jgi:hypothetical protein
MRSVFRTLLLVSTTSASVTVPFFFTDGLVLQSVNQGTVLSRIHGAATPGERVVVAIDDRDAATVLADGGGQWEAQFGLKFMDGKNHNMTVRGESGPSITAHNVTWGDVIVCAGGTDMLAPMTSLRNASGEIATAGSPDFGKFRVFAADSWQVVTPDVIAGFSSMCFETARFLRKPSTGVRSYDDHSVVGLILITSQETNSTIADWIAPSGNVWRSSGLQALAPMAVRGLVWSSGYDDAARAAQQNQSAPQTEQQYATLLHSLIASWRVAFDIGDFPFLVCVMLFIGL